MNTLGLPSHRISAAQDHPGSAGEADGDHLRAMEVF